MSKNYMADVAKMLGVEPNEEFEVVIPDETEHQPVRYQFNSNQFGCWETEGGNSGFHVHWNLLLMILCGQAYIKKLPWQPKKGEHYYFPAAAFQYSCQAAWHNSPIDFALKKVGMIFKTKAECEAALPELRKKYLGGDCNETDD